MKHPFSVLRPEYVTLLATMTITRPKEELAAAEQLLLADNISRYRAVGDKLGIPPALIAALDMRESSANPRSALGQGDPWNKVSTHEPKGFGPFPSWEAAAEFYLKREDFDQTSAAWDMPYCCWKGEAWNGFGPRDHGIHTGYLWAGTNHYIRGKYIADGKWNPQTVDIQLGIIPLMLTMGSLDPSLMIKGMPVKVADTFAPVVVKPVPEGLAGAEWIQWALNKLGQQPALMVDGSYGRKTRAAVRAFQISNGLTADGLAGEKETLPALRRAIENLNRKG